MTLLVRRLICGLKSTKMAESIAQATKTLSGEASKRSLEDTEQKDDNKKLKVESEPREKGLPYRKKKVAMMLVYSGKEYYGMQRNPGFRTIESELLEALVKAGVITKDHSTEPSAKMKFQRAARTDKGVSAAGQVCSLKINVEKPEEKINAQLPEDIRIQSIRRTTQGFDCKNAADARTYLYMIPTFAFCPMTEIVTENYRINEETLQKINEVLTLFLGTHNFHNFTSGKLPTDKSATRYIMSFTIGTPFEKDNLEFAEIKIKGQSFILHQIRKMIGLAIAIVRGQADIDLLQQSWGPEKVDVPKAPGLGLMLDTIHYTYYNRKFGNDGSHQPLEWSDHKDEVEKFKSEFIFKSMVETEKQEKSMMKWLDNLHFHKLKVLSPGESGRSCLWAASKNVENLRKHKDASTDSSNNSDNISQNVTEKITQETDDKINTDKCADSDDKEQIETGKSSENLGSCDEKEKIPQDCDVICTDENKVVEEDTDRHVDTVCATVTEGGTT